MTATRPPLRGRGRGGDRRTPHPRGRARAGCPHSRRRRSAAGSSCPVPRPPPRALVAAGAVGYELPHRSGARRRSLAGRGGEVLLGATADGHVWLRQSPDVPHPPGSAAARGAGDAARPRSRRRVDAALHPAGADERGAGRRAPAGADDDRPAGPPRVVCPGVGRPPVQPRRAVLRRQAGADVVAGDGVQCARLRGGADRRRRVSPGQRRSAPVTACRPTCTISSSPPAGRRSSPPMRRPRRTCPRSAARRRARCSSGTSRRSTSRPGASCSTGTASTTSGSRRAFSRLHTSGQGYDYFHLNSVAEMDDGHLLISARNTCALYKVDRFTGKILWRLNGKRSDFSVSSRGPLLVAARRPPPRVIGDHRVRQRGARQGEAVAGAGAVRGHTRPSASS